MEKKKKDDHDVVIAGLDDRYENKTEVFREVVSKLKNVALM